MTAPKCTIHPLDWWYINHIMIFWPSLVEAYVSHPVNVSKLNKLSFTISKAILNCIM